ncbi:MAG: hypothetical protein I3273_03750 [Candidatus Moeniiplasma glomeromycotorum]|nr:hypothetical protein [Candidatus Moeniiplasma glomeromycotorum]MCE8167955.1 hypothetical protein [Candidatus Moeniiplasma glomeromycotorum]MCE8169210.1 hypothetical protein [Candidatus Moeniiplasma glomeromycotorum]
MKINIKKINFKEEGQKKPENIVKQIEELINNKEILLSRIAYTDWKNETLTKLNWEEAKNYGNQILALILIQEELVVAEEALSNEEWEKVNESISGLEEIISLNDTDLEAVLNWTFEESNYRKKINEILNELNNLLKENKWDVEEDGEEKDYGLINEEKLENFLKEIESFGKEKEVSKEQINDKLSIKLRSGGSNDYRELIKKKIYSQIKLEEWKKRLIKIIQQVELEQKIKEAVRSKPFNFTEFKKIQEELARLREPELPEEILLKKKPEDETDFRATFGVREGRFVKDKKAKEKAKRNIVLKGGKTREEEANKEIAKAWYKAKEVSKLKPIQSLVAWKNGFDPEDIKDGSVTIYKGRKFPYDKISKSDLNDWVSAFDEKAKEKAKKISSKEIIKWWEHQQKTGLEFKEAADAWGNGWNYDEIKNGLGTIIPDANEKNIKESFNIPVSQEKTLAQEKERAKMKLVKFVRGFNISKEEEDKINFVYKNEINQADKAEKIQELLKTFFKKIAYDQISQSLTDFSLPLQESDLSLESQDNIRELFNDASDKIKDTKSTKHIRNSILGEIKIIRELFEAKKELRGLFIGEIKVRLELAEKNNWIIGLKKFADQKWDSYIINEPSIHGDDSDIYQAVSNDLLAKIKEEIGRADNEGKPWELNFTDKDWEELERNFSYDKITDKEEIETINIESVVVAVKNLAISKWKKKIEEKVELAKRISEQEEKSDEEVKNLIEELESIAKWNEEKDGSNQKEALRGKENELYTCLELLKYEFYLSAIQKATKIYEIVNIEEKIRKNVKGGHLPPEKSLNDLYQALRKREIFINLRNIIDSNIPGAINEINSQLQQLNKLSIQATKAEQKVYEKLKEEIEDKELKLLKAKHQQVNSREEPWQFNLTEEYKELIENSENKVKLLVNLGVIEKHFQFYTDFYNTTEISPSFENNKLVDGYRKIKGINGKVAGSIYKNGWKNPDEINEEGFISWDEVNYHNARSESRLQAEIMWKLQNRIDEAKKMIDTVTPEARAVWLKRLLNFNEEWIEDSENEELKKARREALRLKKPQLERVVRKLIEKEEQEQKKLVEKEIQLIWNDMLDENKYDKDYNRLEELVGSRIEALDGKYIDSEGRNKSSLEEVKEAVKERLKFRADFLAVAGEREEETIYEDNDDNFRWVSKKKENFGDEFIYNYQNKGFDGQQAGRVYLNGWGNPKQINSSGYTALKGLKSGRNYSFSVLGITLQEAQERVKKEEKLRNLIYKPEAKDNLEKLKSRLEKIEKFIFPTEPADSQSLIPIQLAYQNNKEEADSKRERLIEAIENLQRQSLINKIDVSVQKINDSIQGQGVKLIEDHDTSRSLNEWRRRINDKSISLEELEKEIKNELTLEISVLLSEHLEELCRLEPKIVYGEIGIRTNIRNHFFSKNYELTELANEGSIIARKIISIRNKHESNAVQEAIDILQRLINKEKSENLEVLQLDLSRIQDLIPVEITESKSLTGRQLTSAEMEAYKQNREAADEKELNLLKEIFRKEVESRGLVLEEKQWKKVEKANNRDKFLTVKRRIAYEQDIEGLLKNSQTALEGKNTSKNQLLELIEVLQRISKSNVREDWEEKALRIKGGEVKEMIKKLKVRFMEFEFNEYIEIINEKNDLSALNGLEEEWVAYLLQEELSNWDMPEGKKVKDLSAEIDRRKEEIGKGKLSQEKSPAKKLAEAKEEIKNLKSERDFFQEQLKKRGIIPEQNNDWSNEILEIIDKKAMLEEKIRQAEEILELPLESLEKDKPSLINLSEIADLLAEIGIELEKNENDRDYYDPEKLRNKLVELTNKETENSSLRETIKDKETKIEQLNNDLEITKGKEDTANSLFSSIGEKMEELEKNYANMKQEFQLKEEELKAKREETESQEKRAKELTENLNNARKEIDDLRKIIAENANRENEERQKNLKEIAKKLGVEEQETENKPVEEIKILVDKEIEKLQQNINKIKRELPELIDETGEINDNILNELRELEENKENNATKINGLENKVRQAENFGLTEWNDLVGQTQGENLINLLNRPKRSEVEELEKELGNLQKELEAEKSNHQNTQQNLKIWTDEFGNDFDVAKIARDKDKIDLVQAQKDYADEQAKHNEIKIKLVNAENERDSRPNITQPEYQRLLANQKPNDLPADWQERLNRIDELEKRPTQEEHNRVIAERDNRPDINQQEWENDYKNRPTEQEKEEAVNNARQQEVDKYRNHIDPADKDKLKEAAEKVGFGFTQKDIDDAVNKEKEKWNDYVDPRNYRTDWIDPNNLESEAKRAGWEYRKEDLDQAVNNEKNKYAGWVDPTIYRVDWIDPNELEEKAQERGMVSAEDYNKVLENQKPENLPSDWEKQIADKDKYLRELEGWKNNFSNQSPEEVKINLDRIPELEKRPDIPITKKEWEDDYSKRPTQAQLDQEVQKEKDKYLNHISPEKLVADYLAKDELEKEARNRGMVSKEEYDEVIKGRDARPDIKKEDWENDYSQRPTQEEYDKVEKERDVRPNTTQQEYDDLVQKLNQAQNDLKVDNDLITSVQNKLGIDNLNNLSPLPEGETLTSLLGRPKKGELEKAEKERDERPKISLAQYQQLLDNQRPGELPEDWKEQLARIPDLEQRPTQESYDKIVAERDQRPNISQKDYDKVVAERDNRPNIKKEDWENDYSKRPLQTDLDQATKKTQDYENGLKIGLGLDNNTLPNWKDEIDKLKNRPTSDNSAPIKGILGLNPTDNLPNDWPTKLVKKDDLATAQDNLNRWTNKFPNKNPDDVEKENRQIIDNLQKELDNWKDRFGGKTPEAIVQELVQADQNKDKLNGWQAKFPSKTAEQVEKELNDLKSKPDNTNVISEQQKKIDDLKEAVRKLNEAVRKYGDELDDYTQDTSWKNEIVDLSKFK